MRSASFSSGIIPAYAGSTPVLLAMVAAYPGSSPHTRGALIIVNAIIFYIRDHPRIRGEHLLRGNYALHRGRIIPAYAGSTHAPESASSSGLGSSPHTRGAPRVR